jgi:phosphinothricin acetyltransferase
VRSERYGGIRVATAADAEAVARIYNDAILDGSYATADVQPVTVASRVQWIAQHADPYDVWVCDSPSDGVIGWGSLNALPIRPAYSLYAEASVYVDRAHRRGLIAPAISGFLVETAAQLGFRGLIAVLYAKNRASAAGARALGFREVVRVPEVTWFKGQWEEVVFLHKDLTQTPLLPRLATAALDRSGALRGG